MAIKDKWVVITRPAHQTENLQLMLEAVGVNTLLFPLIEIVQPDNLILLKEQLDNLQSYDLIVFVSVNAVEETFKYIGPEKFGSVKIATTGKKTASALKNSGVKTDFCPTQVFNSEALLAMPDFKSFCTGKSIAIIRGEGGRDYLQSQLRIAGATVDYINTYQRTCPQKNLDLLAQHAKKGQLDTLVLTSGTSVKNFFELANNESWVNQLTLLIGSPRMQKKIPMSFQGKLAIAEDPSDETLTKKLAEIYQ
ncbi:MAG: uroporphyrinogen-III synthase [Cocleimonas sp.]